MCLVETGHILNGRGKREKENGSENRKKRSLYFCYWLVMRIEAFIYFVSFKIFLSRFYVP